MKQTELITITMKLKQHCLKGILVLVTLMTLNAQVQAMSDDNQIKTVFVFNFTKYIQWPESTNQFIIGIVGGDKDLITAFNNMADKKSGANKKIIIKEISSVSDVTDCQLVYIAQASSSKLPVIANQKNNLLIVTEKAGLSKRGSGINFVKVGGKLRFELNQKELTKRGLKVSSQLIGLSILV